MATSGNFTTTSSYSRSLTFSWSLSSQSVSGNYSVINWSLTGSGSASGYVMSGNFKVVINGSNVYSSSTRIQLRNGTVVSSGSFTIYHNSDGSKSFSASAEAGIYAVAVNCSGSGSWTLTPIPRQATITSAPNFNDENNPTITYTNSAGNSVTSLQACISLTGSAADIPYRDISKTGTSYTFPLTSTERNTLRNSVTNAKSRTVKFYVKTVIGGNTYYSILDRTLTIVNGNPTFSASNLSYKDTNTTVVNITGSNQKIVQNKSTLSVTYTKATALKGASISSYSFTVNGVTKTSTSAGGTVSFGAVDSSSNLTLTATVTDSRGFTTSATKTITMIPYSAPSAIVSLERLNNYENTVKLKVDGSVSSVESHNTMTIQYRYKESGGSYNSFTTINDNQEYTISCNKDKSYIFNVQVTDRFSSTYSKEFSLDKGKFPLFIDTGINAVGINAFPKDGEALRADGGNASFLGDIFMGGDSGQTSEQRVRFSDPLNSAYVHDCKLYGGNPNSTTGIGLWDQKNDVGILQYNDNTQSSHFASKCFFYAHPIVESSDSTGSAIKTQMDNLLNIMPNKTVCPAMLGCYPYLGGNYYYGLFCKHDNNYATFFGFSYNGYRLTWLKYNGTWGTPNRTLL